MLFSAYHKVILDMLIFMEDTIMKNKRNMINLSPRVSYSTSPRAKNPKIGTSFERKTVFSALHVIPRDSQRWWCTPVFQFIVQEVGNKD